MLKQELRAIEKLEKFENAIVREIVKESEGKKDKVFKIYQFNNIEFKVYGTLKRNVRAWEQARGGEFVINVIKEGFKLNMKKMPGKYEEKNNQSYMKHKEFAKEAVLKLVDMKVMKEVDKDGVDCINPLTESVKDEKKLLCIDLIATSMSSQWPRCSR